MEINFIIIEKLEINNPIPQQIFAEIYCNFLYEKSLIII